MAGGRILAAGRDKGAGFAVAPKVIVTANHVVRGHEASSLQFISEASTPIAIDRIERAEELDVALLYLTAETSEVLELSDAADGLQWRVEMRPRGNDPWLTGVISASARRFTNQQKYDTDALQLRVNELLQEYGGYSGSPVMLEGLPRAVVGVLVEELRVRVAAAVIGQAPSASNVLYAIPIRSVIGRFGLAVTVNPAPASPGSIAFSPAPAPRRWRSDAAIVAATLKRLEELPLDVVPPPSALPSGSRMPLAANPLFVGRDDELRALAKSLKGEDSIEPGPPLVTIATGPGGIGKTQLGAELVHRYGRFFGGGIFWLNFADEPTVPTEIAACGLGDALDLRQDFADLPLDERVALVVRAWESAVPSLLVFDNCEDPVLLDRWRPKSGGARALITSRRARWDGTQRVKVVALGYLSRDQSMTLLAAPLHRHQQVGSCLDEDSLDAIAAELGDLPLALHLASSVLALYRDEITPASYLAQLRGPHRFEALEVSEDESGGPSPTHHVQSVARTIALSYERLYPAVAQDLLALTLLKRATCLAPGEPIPRLFLRATVGRAADMADTSRRFAQALGRLIDLGLLEQAAADVLRIHRLVVAFVRGHGRDAGAEAAVEQTLIDAAKQPEDGTGLGALQSHLRFVTDAASTRSDDRAADLCSAMGGYLRTIGDYVRAKTYFERALTIRRSTRGDRDPATVASLADVGFMLKDLGKLAEAQQDFELALKLRRKGAGKERTAEWNSLNDLGFVLKDQGKFLEAQRCFEQALQLSRKAIGKTEPETVTSLNNVGLVYKDQHKFAEAQGYFEEALKTATASGREDRPNAVASLHNLAWVLVDRGQRAAARPYLERALSIQQAAFGEQDPRTVDSLIALGELLARQGDFRGTDALPPPRPERQPRQPFEFYQAAQAYFEKALAIQQRVRGEHHPDTVRTLGRLGRVLYKRRKSEQPQSSPDWQAETYLRQAYDFFSTTFGPEYPVTVEIRTTLNAIEEEKQVIRAYYVDGL